jgi:Ca2+-dependent lipid-binding protein
VSTEVDAFVVAKFSGNKIQTSMISSLNPEWNEILKIGTGIPNKTKYIILEVWNYNRIVGNDLIGVIKIPFTDICDEDNLNPKVTWGHLYGPPLAGKDIHPHDYASKMQIYGN